MQNWLLFCRHNTYIACCVWLIIWEIKVCRNALEYGTCTKCLFDITVTSVCTFQNNRTYKTKSTTKLILSSQFLTTIDAVGSASDSWSVDICQVWGRTPAKSLIVSLSKKQYPYCLVLVGSRNGFERDLHKQELLVSHLN